MSRDFFDILQEMKDWVILSLKCSIDISCLGNRFRVAGHLMLTKGIFQGGVLGSLEVVRHGNGDEIKD